MATSYIKGPLTTARLHVAEANTKYGSIQASETMFRAHVVAASLALLGDHDAYVEHCRRNGLVTKDKQWLLSLKTT